MEENHFNRDLVCVLFPGIVNNDSKALQCLGGIKNISQVYSQPTRKRLGLSYQPEKPFVKKIYGDAKRTAGVLIKVKVKKIKVDNEIKREVISTSVIGCVKKMYKFESMGDFQYLPVHREGAGSVQPQCILEQIVPSGVDSFDFMTAAAPLFIVPSIFTRSDKPINYTYTDRRYPDKRESTPDRDEDVHNRTRTGRGVPSKRFAFNLIDSMPTEPHEYFIKQKKMKIPMYPQLEGEFETVKKLFDERPIWSQNMIRYQTKIKTSSLKIILPCLAFYMKDGPWRMLWVKFGYDPRKEPGARIYQTLDVRIRHTAGVRSMVMTRDQNEHCKRADRALRSHVPDAEVSEGAVYFRPGMAPTQRQIFYQYCDVKLPEVEAVVACEPAAGCLCHQRRGWLPPDTDHVCRDHIFRYIKETLFSAHNADLKLEEASSGDESTSGDGGASPTATEIDESSNIVE